MRRTELNVMLGINIHCKGEQVTVTTILRGSRGEMIGIPEGSTYQHTDLAGAIEDAMLGVAKRLSGQMEILTDTSLWDAQ